MYPSAPEQPLAPAITSGVNSMPTEILAEIFKLCVMLSYGFSSPSQQLEVCRIPSAKEAPLLLCHVCHDWRVIAKATASLWVSLDARFAQSMESYELLEMWLACSRQMPVSLTFLPISENTAASNKQVSIIFPHLIHCSELTVEGWYDNAMEIQPPPFAEQLQGISVSLGESDSHAADWFKILFSRASHLTHLHWVGPPSVQAPWMQIVHLTYCVVDAMALPAIFMELINLVNLELELSSSHLQDPFTIPTVNPALLANVTTFTLAGDSSSTHQCIHIFGMLTLPKLGSLVLRCPDLLPALPPFLDCSQPHLHTLLVQGPSRLHPLIMHASISPSLRQLSISPSDLGHLFRTMEMHLPGILQPQAIQLLDDEDLAFHHVGKSRDPFDDDSQSSRALCSLLKSKLPQLELLSLHSDNDGWVKDVDHAHEEIETSFVESVHGELQVRWSPETRKEYELEGAWWWCLTNEAFAA
ncbi:hypothetical protein C8J57DRAFT_1238275 [Mycena rebaudengoi]|nr:hypothetical protein C8J57DRAFT_1238275 [Mycena rebaudengoi]